MAMLETIHKERQCSKDRMNYLRQIALENVAGFDMIEYLKTFGPTLIVLIEKRPVIIFQYLAVGFVMFIQANLIYVVYNWS